MISLILKLVVVSEGCSSLWCAGFSLWWLLLLRSTGSRRAGFSSCGLWALEHGLSSCGTRAQLLHGMWDLPRPGLESMYPALAGRFLTTAPPGKPSNSLLFAIAQHILQNYFILHVYFTRQNIIKIIIIFILIHILGPIYAIMFCFTFIYFLFPLYSISQ